MFLNTQLQDELMEKFTPGETIHGCVLQVCCEQYTCGQFLKIHWKCLSTSPFFTNWVSLNHVSHNLYFATHLSVVHGSSFNLIIISLRFVKSAGILCTALFTLELARQERATAVPKTLAWLWDWRNLCSSAPYCLFHKLSPLQRFFSRLWTSLTFSWAFLKLNLILL